MKMEKLSIVITLKRCSLPNSVIWNISLSNMNLSANCLIFFLRPPINSHHSSFAFFRWKLLSKLPKMPSQFGPQKVHWKDLRSWTNWQTWLNMTWKHLHKQSQRIRVKTGAVHLKCRVSSWILKWGIWSKFLVWYELLVQVGVDVHELCRSHWFWIPGASLLFRIADFDCSC